MFSSAEDQHDAAEAWQKMETVYGKEFMKQYRLGPSDMVFQELVNNARIRNLLTPAEPGKGYNSISVQVGEVIPGSDDAKELLKDYGQMNLTTKIKKGKWAEIFRQEIDGFVYRNGNADEQTWPLIRKVCLKGPWSILSSGAVLVDLPGVRDSNAARAKVAESYIQNCNQIAIVAPIKRAGKL